MVVICLLVNTYAVLWSCKGECVRGILKFMWAVKENCMVQLLIVLPQPNVWDMYRQVIGKVDVDGLFLHYSNQLVLFNILNWWVLVPCSRVGCFIVSFVDMAKEFGDVTNFDPGATTD